MNAWSSLTFTERGGKRKIRNFLPSPIRHWDIVVIEKWLGEHYFTDDEDDTHGSALVAMDIDDDHKGGGGDGSGPASTVVMTGPKEVAPRSAKGHVSLSKRRDHYEGIEDLAKRELSGRLIAKIRTDCEPTVSFRGITDRPFWIQLTDHRFRLYIEDPNGHVLNQHAFVRNMALIRNPKSKAYGTTLHRLPDTRVCMCGLCIDSAE